MKFIVLVSNGIDSPVSAYVMSKYATSLVIVHASLGPFGDLKEKDFFNKIVSRLSSIISCPLTSFVIPHEYSLQQYKSQCESRFTCVFCKRMMVRYANVIATKEHADALVTGDSLGQVASQTLQNMSIIDQVSEYPILRPLIGFDKEEIIRIAKDIGTYELSILPQKSCTAVPEKPATQTKLNQMLAEEKRLDIERLVNTALEHLDRVDV
jgi:thiamine biosynthesis protein ThiI